MVFRRRKRIKIFLAFALVITIFAAVYFQRNVTQIILSVSEATIRSATVSAVNNAVGYTLSGCSYADLILINYDGAGNVTSIVTNSVKINRIARETASLTQKNLQKLGEDGIDVPLGAFTGIESLAGFGQKVNIKIIPIANVNCTFSSAFVQAGVNQTKHSLYLEVVSQISIILPDRKREIVSSSQVLMCESVIVGNIPNAYLQGGLGGGSVLVPD